MGLIKLELHAGSTAQNIMLEQKRKLMEEIRVLAKIVKSNRSHFKEIEKADYATLEKQLEQYEKKVESIQGYGSLEFTEGACQGIRAAKNNNKN